MNVTKIAGFLHYRNDLGDGVRTGVIFSECRGKCQKFCTDYQLLPKSDFIEDAEEKIFYSSADLSAYLLQEKVFYYSRTPGITFLGSEPLLNPDFCLEVARELKKNQMGLQIYSCATAPICNFEMLSPLTDLFYINYLTTDDRKHRDFTGFSPERVRDNIASLDARSFPYRLRIPVIAGLNEDEAESLALFCRSLGKCRSVVLDFSRSGFDSEREREYRSAFLNKSVILY